MCQASEVRGATNHGHLPFERDQVHLRVEWILVHEFLGEPCCLFEADQGSSLTLGAPPALPETLRSGWVKICARELRFQRDTQTDSLPH